MVTEQVRVEVKIAAPRTKVWDALVNDIGAWFDPSGGGADMSMRLETKVGGRMYRDLGDDAGHLWGFVQVLKPGSGLLEVTGPMWRSAASISHLQIRLTEENGHSTVALTHDIFNIPEEELPHVHEGWTHMLEKGLKAYVEQH